MFLQNRGRQREKINFPGISLALLSLDYISLWIRNVSVACMPLQDVVFMENCRNWAEKQTEVGRGWERFLSLPRIPVGPLWQSQNEWIQACGRKLGYQIQATVAPEKLSWRPMSLLWRAVMKDRPALACAACRQQLSGFKADISYIFLIKKLQIIAHYMLAVL